MSGLPREVMRWIQSLDLTWQVKIPKWDLTNGYLVAEIFSWYYPLEIEMHMYITGTSLESKQKNWSLLQIFFQRHKIQIPEEIIEGTTHCKEGAATVLIELIYELLTNRKIRKVIPENEVDFTDKAYQVNLPYHARSTASQAVKNNLRITELVADKNIILGQQKAQNIINDHVEHRRNERHLNPKRFDKKPTLGELAMRKMPQPERSTTDESFAENQPQSRTDSNTQIGTKKEPAMTREPTVKFKEVKVKQMDRQEHNQQSIQGY